MSNAFLSDVGINFNGEAIRISSLIKVSKLNILVHWLN